MPEESKVSKIIARIQALRNLSKSTHSQGERETTAALAQKLIIEYQLEESQLELKTGEKGEPIDLDSESIIYESGRLSAWKSELAIGVAKLQGLFLYNAVIRHEKTHRKGNRYRVLGRKSDVEIGIYVFGYLLNEIKYLVDTYRPSYKRGVDPERESFALGCVRGYMSKMQAEKTALLSANSTAMVLVSNRAKEAEIAFKEKTGIVLSKSTYRSQSKITDSFNSGFREGRNISVKQGMNTGGETKKLSN